MRGKEGRKETFSGGSPGDPGAGPAIFPLPVLLPRHAPPVPPVCSCPVRHPLWSPSFQRQFCAPDLIGSCCPILPCANPKSRCFSTLTSRGASVAPPCLRLQPLLPGSVSSHQERQRMCGPLKTIPLMHCCKLLVKQLPEIGFASCWRSRAKGHNQPSPGIGQGRWYLEQPKKNTGDISGSWVSLNHRTGEALC